MQAYISLTTIFKRGYALVRSPQCKPLFRKQKFFAVGCGLRLLRPAQFPLKERTWIVIRSASQRRSRKSLPACLTVGRPAGKAGIYDEGVAKLTG